MNNKNNEGINHPQTCRYNNNKCIKKINHQNGTNYLSTSPTNHPIKDINNPPEIKVAHMLEEDKGQEIENEGKVAMITTTAIVNITLGDKQQPQYPIQLQQENTHTIYKY